MVDGYKIKIFALLLLSFLMGGGMFVVMYASGNQVIADNQKMYMVSHTEYRFGEQGQIVVRLVDFQDDPVAVDNCTAAILYPNKTYYAQNQLMSDTNSITGDHYYQFTTPASGPEGVYEYQATCTYASGTRTKSATNSFHLSGAFNNVTSQLLELSSISNNISGFRAEVQTNVSQLLSAIQNINVTTTDYTAQLAEINATSSAISSSLATFTADTQARLSEVNATTDQVKGMVEGLQAATSELNSTTMSILAKADELSAGISELNATTRATYDFFTVGREWFPDTDPDQNYTYTEAMQWLIVNANNHYNSIVNNLNDLPAELGLTAEGVLGGLTYIQNQVSEVNMTITQFQSDVQSNFTQVLNAVNGMAPNDYSAILGQINTTTVSTYDYLTGTMALDINSVLTQLGVINATVNRIEANTQDINSTVNQILQNQNDQVYMNTYSG